MDCSQFSPAIASLQKFGDTVLDEVRSLPLIVADMEQHMPHIMQGVQGRLGLTEVDSPPPIQTLRSLIITNKQRRTTAIAHSDLLRRVFSELAENLTTLRVGTTHSHTVTPAMQFNLGNIQDNYCP